MLHLNAKMKRFKPEPTKIKPTKVKPRLRTVEEPPPRLIYSSYYDCFTVYMPW